MTLFNPSQVQPQQVTKFPGGSSITEFALTTSPVTVLPDRNVANNRRGVLLFNDGTANALFSLGTSVSATAFTAELLPGGYFEDSPSAPWQGPVMMRSTSSPTTINVTELVLI